MRTESKAQDPAPTVHAYDDPHIGPRAFMLAVMRDPTVDIKDRMKAASLLMRIYPHESVCPSLTIHIAPFTDTDAEAGPPGERLENGSHSLEISHKAPSHSADHPGPINLTRYTDPPTPEEIAEIKATVQRLCPDADLSQVPEPRLCACGHWMFYPCNCVTRDPSKLN